MEGRISMNDLEVDRKQPDFKIINKPHNYAERLIINFKNGEWIFYKNFFRKEPFRTLDGPMIVNGATRPP